MQIHGAEQQGILCVAIYLKSITHHSHQNLWNSSENRDVYKVQSFCNR